MDIYQELTEMKEGIAKIAGLLSAALDSETKRNRIYDNADLMKLLHVSRRTLATWRDKGVITFTQYSGKIYYSQADLDNFMGSYHIKSSKYRS